MKIRSLLFCFIIVLTGCGNVCDDSARKLLDEVRDGNLNSLKVYLKDGNDPDLSCYDHRYGKFGTTYELYNTVASSNNIEMVKVFVENTTAPLKHLNEMLFKSINNNNIPTAKYLLTHGAVISKHSGAFYFSRNQDLNDTEFSELMNFLISQDVDFSRSLKGKTNSYYRVQKDTYKSGYGEHYERNMRFLSSQNHDINHPSEHGYFLNRNISILDTEELRLILDLGADPRLKNKRGVTPLMALACGNEQSPSFRERLDLLLTAGSNINEKDLKGNTAITRAKACGHDKTAEYLTELAD